MAEVFVSSLNDHHDSQKRSHNGDSHIKKHFRRMKGLKCFLYEWRCYLATKYIHASFTL